MSMIALLLAAATPAMLTKDQAKAMSSAALADLLLPTGHAPVVAIAVRPVGMDAPSMSVTEVDLMTRPEPDREPGFCRATLWTIPFAPVDPTANPRRRAMPTRAGAATTEGYERWVGNGACAAAPVTVGGGVTGMFRAVPGQERWQRAAVRALAAARKAARGGGPSPFALSYDDKMPGERPLTPRQALAALPVEQVWLVSQGDAALQADMRGAKGERIALIGLDSVWSATLILRGDTITRLALKREIPAPF